jgi:hypothetical protein
MMALPSPIIDQLLDLNRSAQLKGALRIYALAGTDGVAVLNGGVRGWAEALGCGRSYPKVLFGELERLGIIHGVEFYPGEGGQVAEVYLEPAADSITDQALAPALPPDGHDGSHQDAECHAADRSLIEPPHTPLYGTDHDLKQQQHAANPKSDIADEPGMTGRLLRQEFPQVDQALIAAWEADPRVDTEAAAKALCGQPEATLELWHAQIAAAERRRGIDTPIGLVLAIWGCGKLVNSPRAQSRPPERRSCRPPFPPEINPANYHDNPLYLVGDGPDDRAVETEADLPAQAEEARREPPPPPEPAPPPSIPFLLQGAVNMGGQPRNPVEQAFLIERFEAGDDSRAAVRALYNRRRDELARLKARDEALVAEVAQLLGGAPPTPDERRIIASRLGLKDSPEEIAAALRSKRERQPSRKKRAVVDRPPGGD